MLDWLLIDVKEEPEETLAQMQQLYEEVERLEQLSTYLLGYAEGVLGGKKAFSDYLHKQVRG